MDDAYPQATPLLHPEQPQTESTDSQADSTQVVPPKPQDLVPVSTLEEPEVSTTEEPAKVTEVSKRYPTRIRSKPKRLVEEM